MSCQGTVKSFAASKGYGFINFNDQDVFVHVKDCEDGTMPVVGDLVTFEMTENPNKAGSMKAMTVRGCSGTMPDGKGKGKGASMGTGSCQGQVKSFAEVKAWGFITYNGQDVFLHFNECKDGAVPKAGDWVQFDIEENAQKPGTMKARNVTGGSGWPSMGKGKGDWGKGGCGDMWGGYGGGCDFGWSPYGGQHWGGCGGVPAWGGCDWGYNGCKGKGKGW